MKPFLKGIGIAAGIGFLSILAVEPAHPQFGIDIAAILAGLKEVDSTLNSAVASPLRLINQIEQQEQQFQREVLYPVAAINSARQMATSFSNSFLSFRQLGSMNIASAQLPNPETQCSKWVAIDADYEGAYRDLRTLKWELEQDGVHAIVEMSRRGAHLWILCEHPLPARLCRMYIYSLALRLDVPIKGTFKQVDGIEVFPRQDEIGAAEYGNAIRGPLGIHRANMHRYWFEDAPSNLADQLTYLRSVKRLTAAELEAFTRGLSIPESVCSRPTLEVAPSETRQS